MPMSSSPIRDIATEDDGTRLEGALRELAGVTAASVSLAAQVARLEFDLQQVTLDEVTAAAERLLPARVVPPGARQVAGARGCVHEESRTGVEPDFGARCC
jgi:copper chaperone CopZ